MSALPIVEAILSSAAPVTAIAANRIFYSVAPQGAPRPYAVLVGMLETDEALLGGQAQFPEASISVICYSDDFPTVDRLGNAIIAALQDADGVWRGKSAVFRRDSVDSFDFLPEDRVHRRILGFLANYR